MDGGRVVIFMTKPDRGRTMSRSYENFSGILQNWGVTVFEVEKLHRNRHNYIWKINSDGKNYVLRRARGQEAYVREQIKVLDYLKSRRFTYKIPEPINTAQNHFKFINYRNKLFVLYNYIKGEELSAVSSYMSTQAYVRQVGKLVAQFHFHIKGCSLIPDICTERVFTHKPSSYLYAIASKSFAECDPKSIELKKIAYICRQLPSNLGKSYRSLPKTICHSDLQGKNILIDHEKNINGLVDFGSIRTRPRICDITYALKGIASDLGYLNENIVQIFLSEIDKYERITPAEKILMYPFMIQDIALELWWYISQVSCGFYAERHIRMIHERIKLANWLRQNQKIFTSVC